MSLLSEDVSKSVCKEVQVTFTNEFAMKLSSFKIDYDYTNIIYNELIDTIINLHKIRVL